MTEMTRMTIEAMSRQMEETRRMVTDLVVGPAQRTGQQETRPTSIERPKSYDSDSTPLDPGIEAVLRRESEETLEDSLLSERRHWQVKFAELEERNRELELETLREAGSPGPWNDPTQDGSRT